ncbi:MAG: FAD-binding protein [Sutterella sp.]|nr:FAD-binding protein [Sutterella sp.]
MTAKVDMNRRHLISSAAIAACALPAATGMAASIKKADDIHWDAEYDVVVVGYGGAGASAAISAHDAGAKVLIIEKMPKGGGNTSVSAGGVMIPASADDAFTYLMKTFEYAKNDCDTEQVKMFCKLAAESESYLKSLKPETELVIYGYAGFKTLPCADTIRKFRVKSKKSGGPALWDVYTYAVEQRHIPVWLETPAMELIHREGEVVGVVAKRNGKKINICARKAVILTTGGYEFDPESLQNFAQGDLIGGLGSPGNTGDGLRMAQALGARIWHMTSYSCPLGVDIPGYKSRFFFGITAPSYIYVNRDGKRFVNEKGVDTHTFLYATNAFDPVRHIYPAIPAYVIFDEAARQFGPLGNISSGYCTVEEGYRWSFDSSKEIESGVVVKADTIEALAEKIGVPPAALKETVERWNKDIAAGKDTLFGRPITKNPNEKAAYIGRDGLKLSAPLEKGPFYAVKLMPSLLNTQGGPKRDAQARITNVQGKAIPRLYVAGELGSIWGSIYQGACNNAESLVFGRIAGESAAKEKAWA